MKWRWSKSDLVPIALLGVLALVAGLMIPHTGLTIGGGAIAGLSTLAMVFV